MPKKTKSIPVNAMADRFGSGIAIGKASIKDFRTFDEAGHSHRDDYHLFFLQEKGTISIEIDFQKHDLNPFSVIYIHPNQIHRLGAFENVTLSFWAINNENLKTENLNLLEDITPAKAIPLDKETFSVISEAVSLCITISERNHEKLYHSLFKDSCNTLIALVASQYLTHYPSSVKLSRIDSITKLFKSVLKTNFRAMKRPVAYAQELHLSAPYLNECVKKATGQTVSYHIQQRNILEAKRLLYHSDKSVKEIAAELGYEDFDYFSRLFTKVTGMTASVFRNKNRI